MKSGFSIVSSIVLCAVTLSLADDINLPGQKFVSGTLFQPAAESHKTQADSEAMLPSPKAGESAAEVERVSSAPSTRSSFMATWNNVTGATSYLLDVSTNNSFSDYIEGYHDLDVGNVTCRVVTGLTTGTTYYYRVRPYMVTRPGNYSEAMTGTTVATTGLTIHATFDGSITGNPNAAAIEAMINRAVSFYESMFSDPVTIQIRFRYAMTAPDGSPLSAGVISQSNFVVYEMPWSDFINALRADAKTRNDSLANGTLPVTPLSANIKPASANGRAVMLNTPPAMFVNGTVGNGGPYDGIVTLNSAIPYQFSRPVNAGNFDAQRSTEHEMDEVIGFGTHASLSNLRPQDLFSWSSVHHRNVSSNGARYFSINGGSTNIVSFNQLTNGDLGDWLSAPCPQVHPYVQNAFGCLGQSSDIGATSPEGINLDVIGYDLTRIELSNISTRSLVQTGVDVMIGGFIIDGNAPKTVIIRALGPELTHFGIPNALADPTLELHNGGGRLIGSNNDWQTTIIGGVVINDQVSAIQSSGHAPTQPSESAIIATLQPGNYTAIVRGVRSTTGVALVEVDDVGSDTSSVLGNISTRGLVQTGADVMIGGFIIEGSGPKTVIIRAIGPELTHLGVPHALADPALDLHNNNGTLIASNNNWQTTVVGGIIRGSQVSAIQSSGHAPTQPGESAIIATLQPGNYTAIVRGVNNSTGVALVEVYDLQ